MRLALAMPMMTVMFAACAESPVPDIDGIDLIVSPTRTVAYVGFVEDWASHDGRFPQPGECAELETDAVLTGPSCFAALSLGGEALITQDPYGPANPFYGPMVDADVTFHVEACGASFDIPVHPGNYPAIEELHVMASGNDLVVDWITPSAPSVLVTAAGGYVSDGCHETSATRHVFAGLGMPGIRAEVQAFRAPEVTTTPLGPVRVWYGDTKDTSSN